MGCGRRWASRIGVTPGWSIFARGGAVISAGPLRFPCDGGSLSARLRALCRTEPGAGSTSGACAGWRWSSAAAHLAGTDDALIAAAPLRGRVGDWAGFLGGGLNPALRAAIQAGERTGRPFGSAAFIGALETRLGRKLAGHKPGPKPADATR
jgi:putative transposase